MLRRRKKRKRRRRKTRYFQDVLRALVQTVQTNLDLIAKLKLTDFFAFNIYLG